MLDLTFMTYFTLEEVFVLNAFVYEFKILLLLPLNCISFHIHAVGEKYFSTSKYVLLLEIASCFNDGLMQFWGHYIDDMPMYVVLRRVMYDTVGFVAGN